MVSQDGPCPGLRISIGTTSSRENTSRATPCPTFSNVSSSTIFAILPPFPSTPNVNGVTMRWLTFNQGRWRRRRGIRREQRGQRGGTRRTADRKVRTTLGIVARIARLFAVPDNYH